MSAQPINYGGGGDGNFVHDPSTGFTGIGTASPLGQLDLGPGTGVKQLVYGGAGSSPGYQLGFGVDLGQASNSFSLFIGGGAGATLDIVSANQYSWPYSSYTSRLTVTNSGNVGIGNPSPSVPFSIIGNVGREIARFQGSTDSSNNRNFISIYTTNPSYWWEISNQDSSGNGSTNGLAFRERSASDPSQVRVYLASGGNVGINTTTPAYNLDVNGSLHASGNVQFDGALTVNGQLTINSQLTLNNQLTLNSNLVVSGTITCQSVNVQSLNVSGTTTFSAFQVLGTFAVLGLGNFGSVNITGTGTFTTVATTVLSVGSGGGGLQADTTNTVIGVPANGNLYLCGQ